jgi:hypothetical protein
MFAYRGRRRLKASIWLGSVTDENLRRRVPKPKVSNKCSIEHAKEKRKTNQGWMLTNILLVQMFKCSNVHETKNAIAMMARNHAEKKNKILQSFNYWSWSWSVTELLMRNVAWSLQ